MKKLWTQFALSLGALFSLGSMAADIWQEGDAYYCDTESEFMDDGKCQVYPYPTGTDINSCNFFYCKSGSDIYVAGLPYEAKINELVIPTFIEGKPVVAILEDAFEECQFGRVSFESGSKLTTIGYSAFECAVIGTFDLSNCLKLTTVYDSVIDYGTCERIILPGIAKDYRAEGEVFFASMPSGVQSIEIANWSSSCAYKLIDGILYNKAGTELISVPTGLNRATIEIPEGVTTLAAGAFMNVENVQKIVFPSTLRTIKGFAFSADEEAVIRTIDTSKNKNFVSDGGILYDAARKTVYWVSATNTEAKIPYGVTSCAGGVFSAHTALQYIYLPKTMSSYSSTGSVYASDPEDWVALSYIRRCPNLSRIEIESGNKFLKVVDGNVWMTNNKYPNWINPNRRDIVIPDGNEEVALDFIEEIENILTSNNGADFYCPSSMKEFDYGFLDNVTLYAEGTSSFDFYCASGNGYKVHVRTDAKLSDWNQKLNGRGQVELIQDINPNRVITLDPCGGLLPDSAAGSLNKKLGSTYGTLPIPTRYVDGFPYSFVGWFTRPDGEGGDRVTSTSVVRLYHETLYAHWSLLPVNEPFDFLDILSAFIASKAVTLKGAVYDGSDVVGIVELKVGKLNTRTGTSRISATVTGMDGKKKTAKAVTVSGIDGESPVTVSLNVKGWGTMTVTIGGEEFSGDMGDYIVQSAEVGGAWTNTDAAVYVDVDDTSMFSGEVIEDCLPYGEEVLVKNGKWSFAKAASVKYAKPRGETEKELIIDDSKGRTNLSGMKLTYTPKTGVFKGSFKVYALEGEGAKAKLKKYTANVTGFVIDGIGKGTATVKKPAASWPVSVE